MLLSLWSNPEHLVRRIIEDTFGEYPLQLLEDSFEWLAEQEADAIKLAIKLSSEDALRWLPLRHVGREDSRRLRIAPDFAKERLCCDPSLGPRRQIRAASTGVD